ncbi:hypothetical protein [Woodsholea maritima]|uniref:hypothetical protein n=1 Tax=Woodsholea maritima TaxID=240237 RepID=UPI000368B38F|nr:hypothetical protein [Woodsholea maritima]
MEEYLNLAMSYIQPVMDWLMNGVAAHGPQTAAGDIAWIHLGIQMGVIALIMALLMQEYAAILIMTVVGLIVHVIVDIAFPMIREGAEFAVPPVSEMAYWQYMAFGALVYFVGITVLYLVKSLILPRE